MNAVEELQDILAAHNYGVGNSKACVDWAVERLTRNEDDSDKDIILLASSACESEIEKLSRRIIRRYLPPDALNEELWAGKLLTNLYARYKAGTITITELEPIVDTMYRKLNYPNWLVMLSRNCEYATDIEPFEKPFEDEFEYINDLWRESKSVEDFEKRYDRRVSDTHDIR
jgi:hypothetical protein